MTRSTLKREAKPFAIMAAVGVGAALIFGSLGAGAVGVIVSGLAYRAWERRS